MPPVTRITISKKSLYLKMVVTVDVSFETEFVQRETTKNLRVTLLLFLLFSTFDGDLFLVTLLMSRMFSRHV